MKFQKINEGKEENRDLFNEIKKTKEYQTMMNKIQLLSNPHADKSRSKIEFQDAFADVIKIAFNIGKESEMFKGRIKI